MSEQHKKNEKNFLIQGSILAIAGVITKLIGAFYRIPLLNIIGTEGNGYYSVAFSIYSVHSTHFCVDIPDIRLVVFPVPAQAY